MSQIVKAENFKKDVLEAEGVVLVDFYADWCGPCKTLGPVIDAVAQEFEGKAKVYKLNVDDAGQLAAEYNVMSIPTLIVFKNGEQKETVVGGIPKAQIENLINKHM